MRRGTATSLALRLALMLSIAWIVAGLGTTTFAPQLLLLDDVVLGQTAPSALVVLLSACALSTLLALVLVRRVRSVFASDPDEMNPKDVYALYRLPINLGLFGLVATCAVTALPLVPALRPSASDLFTQISLMLLLWTTASASALATYVLMRAHVGRIIAELPPAIVRRAVSEHHEAESQKGRGLGHVRSRLVLTTVVAVTFVALSSSLLVVAHARALEVQARDTVARDIALAVGEPLFEGDPGPARAFEAAAKLGFQVASKPGIYEPTRTVRRREGMSELRLLTPQGNFDVLFETARPSALYTVYAVLFALAFALAWVLGSAVGGFYERDLALATAEVRLMSELGSEEGIRADATMKMRRRRPLFGATADLIQAVDGMREVFGRFAEVHRQAIVAKEQTERMRALFLASMSHDLKGPLNAILGFGELVRQEQLLPAQRENIDIIAQRGRELLHLIQTVLDAARIEAGELTMLPRPTYVDDIVTDAVREARELLEGSEIAVDAQVQARLSPIFADPERVTQALLNVIMSVARFTQKNATVTVRALLPEHATEVRMDVESHAGSIPAEELEKIFVAFRFPEQARRHGSLGLGLYIARSVIEIHGGRIDVEPSPSGLVFRLTFGAREEAESLHMRSLRSLPVS